MVKSLKPSLNTRGGVSWSACNVCDTEFRNENDEKNHYMSEWHRCNLKCKIAGVPGMTKALFLNRKTTVAKEKNKLNVPSKQYTCGLCGKGFGSSEARAQHLNSQSHITQVIQDGHLNASKTIVKTPAPHMVNKLSQNEENNKLNAPSKLHCVPCGKGFGSSEAYAQHLNSQSHITRAPRMVNTLSQNEEKNKLNAPSKLYTCGLCGIGFGSSEAYAQHLNSQSHMTRKIQVCHLNESTTKVKTLAPHMVNKRSQNEEYNKLNAPSKLYTCGLCGIGFGSSEAYAQHLNSQSHMTRKIQVCHLNESTTIVKTLAPHMVNKVSRNEEKSDLSQLICDRKSGSSEAHAQHPLLAQVIQDYQNESKAKTLAPCMANKPSQNDDEWEEVYETNEWEEVDGSNEWEEIDVSDGWEEVGE